MRTSSATKTLTTIAVMLYCTVAGAPAAVPVEETGDTKDGENGNGEEIDVPGPGDKEGNEGTSDANGTDNRSVADSVFLRFLNKDRLHGKVVSIDGEKGITFKHRDAKRAVNYKLANVRDMKIASQKNGKNMPGANAVYLTNGDKITGEIKKLDQKLLAIKTGYAGVLHVRRPMIKMIRPGQTQSSLIYSGPDGKEGWGSEHDSRQWSYRDHVFVCNRANATIGRKFDLPNQFKLSFQAAWSSRVDLEVLFCADELEDHPENAYQLMLSHDDIYLNRRSDHDSDRVGRLRNVGEIENKRTVQVGLYVDKKDSKFYITLDGQLKGQWRDQNGFVNGGKYLIFMDDRGHGTRVGNITLAKWDGEPPGGGSSKSSKKQDTVLMVNGDQVSGKAKKIDNGKLILKTDYATLNVPLKRITNLRFASASRARARRNKNDVQLTLTNQDRITLKLHSLAGDALTGSTENFKADKVNIDRGVLKHLGFNLYDERREELEKSSKVGAAGPASAPRPRVRPRGIHIR